MKNRMKLIVALCTIVALVAAVTVCLRNAPNKDGGSTNQTAVQNEGDMALVLQQSGLKGLVKPGVATREEVRVQGSKREFILCTVKPLPSSELKLDVDQLHLLYDVKLGAVIQMTSSSDPDYFSQFLNNPALAGTQGYAWSYPSRKPDASMYDSLNAIRGGCGDLIALSTAREIRIVYLAVVSTAASPFPGQAQLVRKEPVERFYASMRGFETEHVVTPPDTKETLTLGRDSIYGWVMLDSGGKVLGGGVGGGLAGK